MGKEAIPVVGADRQRAVSPAVDRALTILETLVAADAPMTLTALARAAGIPVATCASIMQTLESRGYTSRRIVGRSHLWRPTLRLSGLAAELARKLDVAAIADPYLKRLVDATGMAAHIGALEGTAVVYVAKASAPGMVQFNTYPGKTVPFFQTALGRAIASQLPPERVTPLLHSAKPGSGPAGQRRTLTQMRALLDEIRERGYAVESEEEDAGIGCVAAPYFDALGQVVGSVGVTGFAERIRGAKLKGVAGAVLSESRALSAELAGAVSQEPVR